MDALRKKISGHNAATVGRQTIRDEAKAVVQQYFRSTRVGDVTVSPVDAGTFGALANRGDRRLAAAAPAASGAPGVRRALAAQPGRGQGFGPGRVLSWTGLVGLIGGLTELLRNPVPDAAAFARGHFLTAEAGIWMERIVVGGLLIAAVIALAASVLLIRRFLSPAWDNTKIGFAVQYRRRVLRQWPAGLAALHLAAVAAAARPASTETALAAHYDAQAISAVLSGTPLKRVSDFYAHIPFDASELADALRSETDRAKSNGNWGIQNAGDALERVALPVMAQEGRDAGRVLSEALQGKKAAFIVVNPVVTSWREQAAAAKAEGKAVVLLVDPDGFPEGKAPPDIASLADGKEVFVVQSGSIIDDAAGTATESGIERGLKEAGFAGLLNLLQPGEFTLSLPCNVMPDAELRAKAALILVWGMQAVPITGNFQFLIQTAEAVAKFA